MVSSTVSYVLPYFYTGIHTILENFYLFILALAFRLLGTIEPPLHKVEY